MIERTTPEKVSTELIIRMSILLDHLPTNFDVAFARAMETLNLSKDETEAYEHSGAAEHIAEMGLKGTTERGGGQGHVLGQSERR